MGRIRPLALLLVFAVLPASAEVEQVEITRRELVAEGKPFGLVGPYRKLVGKVHFALDPLARRNRQIVDLDRAPRGADGRVYFSADLYVLQPADPSRGNGTLLFEVSNRGRKAAVRYFNRNAARTTDPSTSQELGDGFLMRHGFTVAWVGWQYDVPPDDDLLRLRAVYATEGKKPIEGLVRADHVFSEPDGFLALGNRGHLAYPVADPRDPRNTLTVRNTRLGKREILPRDGWRFARAEEGDVVPDPRSIYLPSGFVKGKIYEAVYVARDPAVVGLGLAAVRDFVSWAKHDRRSIVPAERTIALGISQTGRFLRTFLYQGFNVDLEGRRVLDGMMVHTAGAGRGSFNHRFGQPSRDAHPFSAFFYPTDIFPFTGKVQRDGVAGLSDGLLERLRREDDAVPRIFFTNTGYEYWGRAASLIHTSVDGRTDVDPSSEVRIYHLASTQHFVDRFPPAASGTLYPANSADFLWCLRALLLAMNAWIADGTLVAPRELAFPELPGVRVPRQPHEAYRVDYGRRFRKDGIVEHQPPRVGKAFPVLVPQVDADGNELGGLRLPEIAVPLATYAPWNWRAPEIGAPGELADFRGAFFPLPVTAAGREASGDPRPSIEERYGGRAAYVGRYTEAALRLVEERRLLAEDLPETIEHALRVWDHVVGRALD